jgi:hypothetical protein
MLCDGDYRGIVGFVSSIYLPIDLGGLMLRFIHSIAQGSILRPGQSLHGSKRKNWHQRHRFNFF